MVLLFDRKVKRVEGGFDFSDLKSKGDLLTRAVKQVIENEDSLDAVRFSLLKHASENTKLSLTSLDASFEKKLKAALRKEGRPPLKTVGSRDVSIVQKRTLEETTDEKAPKKPKPTFERKTAEKRKEIPEDQDSTTAAPPSSLAPEGQEEEDTTEEAIPDGEVAIETGGLPQEALEEYTEVSAEDPSTLPSGAEPFEKTDAQQAKKLGEVEQEITPIDGPTVTTIGIDTEHDNGGHDIVIVDNGGDLVRRQLMQDVINEMTFENANLFAKEMDLEPADIPLPDGNEGLQEDVPDVPMEDKAEESPEEFPPRPQKPLPEQDVVMKDTPGVKREETRRGRIKDIRNNIFQKIARDEAEFKQAWSGTNLVIRDTGEGLFLNLKKSKQSAKARKDIKEGEQREEGFMQERIKLQENAKNQRIMQLRMQAASDTALSSLEIYNSNSSKILEKIKTNPANRSLIVSSYRDPDTFNEIKYLTDANGDLILNEATGAPYIESISALKRDDAAKLIKQRRAVDGSDLPSNYYPMYGKQSKDFFSKNEYSFLGRQFVNGKKLKSLPSPPNITGRIKELLDMIGGSVGIEDRSIKEPVFKQWVELETLKNSYDNYTSTADYQYEQDKLSVDQDGSLVDENAMLSAAKILQNITAQQLIKAMSAGQASLGAQEQSIRDEPTVAPAEPIVDKQQETGEVEEGQMDVEKDPEQVRQESVNLSSWMNTSAKSYNPPSRARIFEPTNFPAFGGEDTSLSDGVWV